MTVVNFSIPNNLDMRMKVAIRRKGFPSKAELFRFALIKYLDEEEIYQDIRLKELTEELGKEISKKFKNKKIPSIREQLKNI